MTFTHLQVKSGYSLMESTVMIEPLVKRAKALNFTALALTDLHVMYGAVHFYRTCLKHRIKPLLGLTVSIFHEEAEEQCILIAKDYTGYKQLVELSTYINTEALTGIDFSALKSFLSDNHVFTIILVQEGPLEDYTLHRAFHRVEEHLKCWKQMVNEDSLYLGISSALLARLEVEKLSEKINHQVVAVNNVVYLEEKDFLAFDCLQAMKDGVRWDWTQAPKKSDGRYLRSAQEMHVLFDKKLPYAIKNIEEIVDRCEVTLPLGDQSLPSYPVPEEKDAATYLRSLCYKYAKKRYGELRPSIKNRLDHELNVIDSMNFNDYFLIVWDFVSYAKSKGIFVGPGRGSAAGSIVAYVLGITDVDPLEYGLLFERFLNPERISMPDIDIDFPDHRREEVIDYVRKKYGETYVAQIITFGTFKARALLRELFKTLGVEQKDAQYILSYIPAQTNLSLYELVQRSKELKRYIRQTTTLRILFKIALILENLPRHVSTHAAGIVISRNPLTERVPLTLRGEDAYMTQYAMDDLEALGLLKIDLLGLKNLSVIENIVKSIKESPKEAEIFPGLKNIPLKDEKTLRLLQRGLTRGVFQLESQGMRRVLRRLKPTSLEDLIAVNALYRPGPMDYITTYIRRKHRQEQITYPHPDLKPILKDTYGVLIYQEQIMQIAHQLAGFSLKEADLFRRAISTKDESILHNYKESFIQGCLKNGYQASLAEEVFSWIVKFSNYGFNRSHAVAYSQLSYMLAYLKAHYPNHFYAKLLTSEMRDPKKVRLYIQEAEQLQVKIKPPHINKSARLYTVENDGIRIGLSSIKGVHRQAAQAIIQARKKKPFENLFDFCLRVPLDLVQKEVIEALILAGAFDALDHHRARLLANLDQAMEQGKLFHEFTDQLSLLKDDLVLNQPFVKVQDFSLMQKLSYEKELLGVYVSNHPFLPYRSYLKSKGYITMGDLHFYVGKKYLKSVAIVQAVKKIRTRRGDPMAFLTISDEFAPCEAVLFPHVYREVQGWLKENIIISLQGNIGKRKDQLQWIIHELNPFDFKTIHRELKRIFIKVTQEVSDKTLPILASIAKDHPGTLPVYIFNETNNQAYRLADRYRLNPEESTLQKLQKTFGKHAVALQ